MYKEKNTFTLVNMYW